MGKQDQTASEPETYTDSETGLVLRRDPFGGDAHDIVGWSNPADWEILEEDFGEVIDWPTTPTVAGKLTNQKVVMIDHDDTRGESPTNIYSILDAVSGVRRAFYGNYQLDQALGCPKPEDGQKSPYLNRVILVQWQGKREQGKGGRSLNVYTVAVKREPIAEEEPF